MKIAITADPEIPVPPIHYGGIERIVEILVQELVREGHEVHLFAHPDSKVPARLIPWKGKASNSNKDTLVNMSALFTKYMKESYDVVHSFGRLAYMLPLMPLKANKMMSYQREPSLVQIRKAIKISRANTLRFTGCSNYITNQIKPFGQADTVYNCVDTSKFNYKERVEDNAPLVFLGRIEPIKGTHIAIEIAQKSERSLLIAGNIPKEGKEYFNELIKPHLNSRVQYIGPVNDQQKNEMLGEASAFLMPIQWNEPFGIVMAEAMACGTPVLGLPFGSVPEVVEEGINGFICNSVEAMVNRINDLPQISRFEVRKNCERRFSETVVVGNYLNIYKDFLN